MQIRRRRFIPAISLAASADLSGKTYVLGIVKGTQRVARIFNGKRTIPMVLTIEQHTRQARIAHEIIQIQNTEHLLVLTHPIRTILQMLRHSSKRMRSIPCLLNLLYLEESPNLINQPRPAPALLEAI